MRAFLLSLRDLKNVLKKLRNSLYLTILMSRTSLAVAWPLILLINAKGASVWTPQVSPKLAEVTQASLQPGSGFSLAIEAPPGSYDLTYSQNPSEALWQSLTTLNPLDGTASFLHAPAATRPRGFYRVGGTYTSEDYHVIIPAFALEWGFVNSQESTPRGDLTSEIVVMDAGLDSQNNTSALLRRGTGTLSQQYISPTLDFLEGYSATTHPRNFDVVTFSPHGFLAPIAAGPYSLPYAEATREAFTFSYLALEPDRASLVAQGSRSYSGSTSVVNPPDPAIFDGRKVEMPFLIRKSTNANANALAGAWGKVSLTAGTTFVDLGASFVSYQNNVSVAEIIASSPTLAVMNVSRDLSVKVDQPYDAIENLQSYSDENIVAFQLPIQLTSEGSITLGGVGLTDSVGAASPTSDLIVVARADPSPTEVPEDGFFSPEETMETEVAIAVRRTLEPELAGKSYRVLHLGFSVSDGSFKLNEGSAGDQITFDEDGTAAAFTATQKQHAVTFGGTSSLQTSLVSRSYDVEVEADGVITLSSASGAFLYELKGFAQVGSDQIILAANNTNTLNDEQEMALVVLIRIS